MDDLTVVGLVFFGSILVCGFVYWSVCALAAWVDRNSPLKRADRRQLRSVTNGKRAMAGER